MLALAFNSDVAASLNQLQAIPLPILKLISTQVFESLSDKRALNYSQLSRIMQNQRVHTCNLRKGINALQYVIKYSAKKQISSKAIIAYLKDYTLLSKDFLEHFYEQYESSRTNSRIPCQATLLASKWAICNLRQTKKGEIVNKMYVKTQLTTLQDGCENNQVFSTQLSEHKLLLRQINDICAKVK